MGNIGSFQDKSTKSDRTLSQTIDFIATNYILTQNYEDMKKLNDINYCDNLIILTSDIISNNLKYSDIKYLSQRLKSGSEINEMTTDNIIYFDKRKLNNLDIKNKTNKRRMCIGIAKFYIKIAHLFAAIVSTINPTYTFKDSSGREVVSSLSQRENIPIQNEVVVEINKASLCTSRINALLNNYNYDVSNDDEITIKPKFCNMNINNKKLGDEGGIPELEYLYYDKYNYDQGVFGGRMYIKDNMSEKMYLEYQKDLLSFYKKFTGNDKIPLVEKVNKNGNVDNIPAITKFSQIPLKSYHKTKGCSNNGLFTKEVKGTLKEKLFADYANHLKQMMERTENSHNKLLEIIDTIFVFKLDSLNNKKDIIINPKLTDDILQELINKSRLLITELYLNCEDDFTKGLDIFEAIIENQIMITSKSQINELEKIADKAISNVKYDYKVSDEDVVKSVSNTITPVISDITESPSKIMIKKNNSSLNNQSYSNSQLSQPMLSQLSLSQPMLSQLSLSQPMLSQRSLSQPMLSQRSLSQPMLSQRSLSQPMLSQRSLSQPIKSQFVISQPIKSQLSPSQLSPSQPIKSQFALSQTILPKSVLTNNNYENEENEYEEDDEENENEYDDDDEVNENEYDDDDEVNENEDNEMENKIYDENQYNSVKNKISNIQGKKYSINNFNFDKYKV
jgi:hypothetical protein